jgi:hypothetical protein
MNACQNTQETAQAYVVSVSDFPYFSMSIYMYIY